MAEQSIKPSGVSSYYKFLTTTYTIQRLSAGIYAPLYSIYLLHLGGNLRMAGELVAIYTVTGSLCGILLMKANEHTRNYMFFTGYLLSFLGAIWLLMAKHPAEIYVIQGIFGIGSSLVGPTQRSRIYAHLTENTPFYYQVYTTLGTLASAAAAIIGGYLGHHIGFDFVFTIMAFTSGLACLLSFKYFYGYRGHLNYKARKRQEEARKHPDN